MKKNRAGALKLLFIGIVIGLLLVANVLIGGKIDDRYDTYLDARESISNSSGGAFSLRGIYIAIPYLQTYLSEGKEKTKEGFTLLQAKSINYVANLQSENRSLGIYNFPIFTGEMFIDADFDIEPIKDDTYKYGCKYFPSKAKLIIELKDTLLLERPEFQINGKDYASYYYSSPSYCDTNLNGIVCDLNLTNAGSYNLTTKLKIRGAKNFRVDITSAESYLAVKSDWTAPGFTGFTYLPDTHEITDQGFTAKWNIPFDSGSESHDIGFSFIKPVSLYKQLERAHNYAFLFIIVPFIVLFMFEIFASINLHPINYLLSGAASVIFFLLLLSISEHLNFSAAYLIGALASGVLISLYVISITRKYKLGLIMALVFAAMYTYLFLCLKSEDYALLMGSIFAFIVLAALMFITRKVDWANLKKRSHTEIIQE